MSKTAARMHLTRAVTGSCDGRDADVTQHVAAAERRLHDAGQHTLADRLATIEDVTTTDARERLRAVMTVLDGSLNPSVNRASFRPASDGGVER